MAPPGSHSIAVPLEEVRQHTSLWANDNDLPDIAELQALVTEVAALSDRHRDLEQELIAMRKRVSCKLGMVARPAVPKITRRISALHGVLASEVMSPSRVREVSRARDHIWAECYATGWLSLPQIARAFRRDHTSVLAGIRRHCDRAAGAAE